jgi:hypothetical protein
MSLTNDMERALLEIANELGDRMPEIVIYRDSQGQYDRVRHRNGVFGGFDSIGAKSLMEALAAVKSQTGAKAANPTSEPPSSITA